VGEGGGGVAGRYGAQQDDCVCPVESGSGGVGVGGGIGGMVGWEGGEAGRGED